MKKTIVILLISIFILTGCNDTNITSNTPVKTVEENIVLENDDNKLEEEYEGVLIEEEKEKIQSESLDINKTFDEIKIYSPVYTLTGTVLPETDKVEIIWKNGEKTDNYFLKKFIPGDKEFLTNLRIDYENIDKGLNEYLVKFYIDEKHILTYKYLVNAEYDEIEIEDKIFYVAGKLYRENGIINGLKTDFILYFLKYPGYLQNEMINKIDYEYIVKLDKWYYAKELNIKRKSNNFNSLNLYNFEGNLIYNDIYILGLDGHFRIEKIENDIIYYTDEWYQINNYIKFQGKHYVVLWNENGKLGFVDREKYFGTDNEKYKIYFLDTNLKSKNITELITYEKGKFYIQNDTEKYIIFDNGIIIDYDGVVKQIKDFPFNCKVIKELYIGPGYGMYFGDKNCNILSKNNYIISYEILDNKFDKAKLEKFNSEQNTYASYNIDVIYKYYSLEKNIDGEYNLKLNKEENGQLKIYYDSFMDSWKISDESF